MQQLIPMPTQQVWRVNQGSKRRRSCVFLLHQFYLQIWNSQSTSSKKSYGLSQELNLSNVLFKLDCLQVTQVVKSFKSTRDEMCSILYDIHLLLKLAQYWKVQFNHQETNRATHSLAKLASTFVDDRFRNILPLLVIRLGKTNNVLFYRVEWNRLFY